MTFPEEYGNKNVYSDSGSLPFVEQVPVCRTTVTFDLVFRSRTETSVQEKYGIPDTRENERIGSNRSLNGHSRVIPGPRRSVSRWRLMTILRTLSHPATTSEWTSKKTRVRNRTSATDDTYRHSDWGSPPPIKFIKCNLPPSLTPFTLLLIDNVLHTLFTLSLVFLSTSPCRQ